MTTIQRAKPVTVDVVVLAERGERLALSVPDMGSFQRLPHQVRYAPWARWSLEPVGREARLQWCCPLAAASSATALSDVLLVAAAGQLAVSRRLEGVAEYLRSSLAALAAGQMVPGVPLDGGPGVIARPVGAEVVEGAASLEALDRALAAVSERHIAAVAAHRLGRLGAQGPGLGALTGWGNRLGVRLTARARLALHLTPPSAESADWILAPVLVSVDDPTTVIVLDGADDAVGALGGRWRDLVAGEWARVGEVIPALVEREAVTGTLSDDEVAALVAGIDELGALGIEVHLPAAMRRGGSVRATVSVQAPSHGVSDGMALTCEVRLVDRDGVETALTAEQVALLAADKAGLVRLGRGWITVSGASRAALARLVARTNLGGAGVGSCDLHGVLDLVDLAAEGTAMTDAEGGEGDGGAGLEVTVDLGPWWEALAAKRALLETVVAPAALTATLRDYQRDGLAWLTWLEEAGMGGVLADHMGLGKTVQVLARIVADHGGPTLVVCPTSVIGNWVSEAARHAPSLVVGVAHGSARASVASLASQCDVVVTTYGILRRDPALAAQVWHRVVLDEAQMIKNPHTSTAKAARSLKAPRRLALTGTPVENHLGDLWSIFAFVQPGLLGSLRAFEQRFLGSAVNNAAFEALRAVTAPFLLRRLKTDPGVADELPERIDIEEPCALTAEQVGLYEAMVQSMLVTVEDSAGAKRRTNILAGINDLKKICAHPSMVADPTRMTGRSGKLTRLEQLLAEIVEGGEAALVFSQYPSLFEGMAPHLRVRLGCDVLTLTGQMSAKRRTRIVEEFNTPGGPPVLLVSTKAGGVGLNLVRASHVIHYDHWWNPATEDQASDRAWRIGQQRTVMVHHLRCPGTLETRIAEVVSGKRDLARRITGTNAIVALDNDELADFVSLASATLHAPVSPSSPASPGVAPAGAPAPRFGAALVADDLIDEAQTADAQTADAQTADDPGGTR